MRRASNKRTYYLVMEVSFVRQNVNPVGVGLWENIISPVRVSMEGNPVPTNSEMQSIAYAAKMEYAKQIRKRKKS